MSPASVALPFTFTGIAGLLKMDPLFHFPGVLARIGGLGELGSVRYGDQQLRDEVMRRLEAADQIAIDLNGRTVTLASRRAPQITFQADGRSTTIS